MEGHRCNRIPLTVIMDQDKIRTRWFKISELYKDDSKGQLPHIKPDTAGIHILLRKKFCIH